MDMSTAYLNRLSLKPENNEENNIRHIPRLYLPMLVLGSEK